MKASRDATAWGSLRGLVFGPVGGLYANGNRMIRGHSLSMHSLQPCIVLVCWSGNSLPLYLSLTTIDDEMHETRAYGRYYLEECQHMLPFLCRSLSGYEIE